MGHARALLAGTDDSARIDLARQAVAQVIRSRLELLSKASSSSPRKETRITASSHPDAFCSLQRITDAIRRHLQTVYR